MSVSHSLSGAEAELLPDAAPAVVWRLVEAVEKHGEFKTNAGGER